MSRRITSLLLAATLLITAPALAGTITVSWTGSEDYETIQEGLDAASEGDTVLVLSGTYAGAGNRDLDFRGLGIALVGQAGAGGTTIDCEQIDRAFLFDDGEGPNARVERLTIVNGAADLGGGARITASSPSIRSCAFRNCVSTGHGGAIMVDEGAPALDACVFESNTADEHGGAVYLQSSPATFAACSFAGNSADYEGAVYGRLPAAPMFDACTFTGNSTRWTGGAVNLYGCSPAFSHCRFESNTPGTHGTVFSEYSSPTFSYCTFWGNCSGSTSGGGRDIHLYHTDIWDAFIENCTFSGWCLGGNGGYLLYFEHCAPRVQRSIIAFCNHGGAIGCAGEGTPTVTNCVIFGNTGGDDPCGDHHDNLFCDPLVCDFWEGDLTLCWNSACLPPNNPWDVLIGAHELGCGPCTSPVAIVSWGQIKAMYR
jgi:predicted outer membrane repeat protein